ncbi:hypothetical protein [Agaribacterium sp. ZY112]|uniref:hypothetical protein n=1 Tax=Agaribacterium sp. ZY112 TaxID=3233574 RepID=UPI003523A2EB
MKYFILVFWLLLSLNSHSYTQATGTIKEIYIDKNGAVALKLNEGFSSSVVSAECSTYNGYAGIRDSEPAMKSLLLAAYAAKATIKLGITGCDGNWLKINDVRGY